MSQFFSSTCYACKFKSPVGYTHTHTHARAAKSSTDLKCDADRNQFPQLLSTVSDKSCLLFFCFFFLPVHVPWIREGAAKLTFKFTIVRTIFEKGSKHLITTQLSSLHPCGGCGRCGGRSGRGGRGGGCGGFAACSEKPFPPPTLPSLKVVSVLLQRGEDLKKKKFNPVCITYDPAVTQRNIWSL